MKIYHFFLIKPSLYDDEGYVIRFSKGVLPSNTLIVLNGLFKYHLKNLQKEYLYEYKITLLDEIVDKINISKIYKQVKINKEIGVVMLSGVQSNQITRATDLALEFKKLGFFVFVGGFHVSGILSIFKKPDFSLEILLKNHISIVAGEVENSLPILLKDIFQSTVQNVYNFLDEKPNLDTPILPEIPKNYLKKFAVSNFSTLDLGRGCPYQCSFCTIINVHGNLMRFRDPQVIKNYILENYFKNQVDYYFFTDDNFARNKNWREILNVLIQIRKTYKIPLRFMIQVDTLAYKIPDFISLLKEAGCTQVFVGMESLNSENLKLVGKRQNKVEDFKNMIETWNSVGINVHTGYIIGFPYDTPDSVKKDVEYLNQIGVQQASFFILTPLPGSIDHKKMLEENQIHNFDFNFYDSFHLVWNHKNFSPKKMEETFFLIWQQFYSFKNIIKRIYKLSNLSFSMAENMLGNYLWYKYSIIVHKLHPMVCGFHRKKSFSERRPFLKKNLISFIKFILKRTFEIHLEMLKTFRIGLEFFFLWSIFYILKILKKHRKKFFMENKSAKIYTPESITKVEILD
ncbi:MAG: B12-binding domain-containing radical SAM protein [Leptonema sp. (in: bacteria)]